MWSLDDTVAQFIPRFAANGKHEVTIRHLLTHSTGFSGWAATYCHARRPGGSVEFHLHLAAGLQPGTSVQYSDIGYSVIGHLVRCVTGETLDLLLARRVWQSWLCPTRLLTAVDAEAKNRRHRTRQSLRASHGAYSRRVIRRLA